MNVWPGKAPGGPGTIGPEQWQKKKVTNVTEPSLEFFRPDKSRDIGIAVIVCPGGGYRNLMMDYEGEDVARWLNTLGVTGIVLKYRVPAPEGTPRHLPALQDAQRTISLVRSKANDWNIDPHRVGILGFSAGGHLSAAAAASFDKRTYDPIDEVDKASCRPDFAVVIYPGGLLDKDHPGQLTSEVTPTKDAPPTFIAQAHDDRVNSENAAYLYLALKKAGVSAELHIYAKGGHGFGIKPAARPASTWTDRCEDWMKVQGILKPNP